MNMENGVIKVLGIAVALAVITFVVFYKKGKRNSVVRHKNVNTLSYNDILEDTRLILQDITALGSGTKKIQILSDAMVQKMKTVLDQENVILNLQQKNNIGLVFSLNNSPKRIIIYHYLSLSQDLEDLLKATGLYEQEVE